jgi:hypothetical protein
MNSSVKVIKRDKDEISTEVQAGHDQRTITQRTRKIRRTVKGWVAELHRRRRDEELAASAFRKMRVTLPLIVLFILCVATESNCQQLRDAFRKVEGTSASSSALFLSTRDSPLSPDSIPSLVLTNQFTHSVATCWPVRR